MKQEFSPKVLFSATIHDFEVMPSPRIHHSTRWTKRAKKYMEMKGNLAALLKTKYKGETITEPVAMKFFITLPHRRKSDIDNLYKPLADALQDAEIIKNDSQIEKIEGEIYRKPKGEATVAVCIRELEASK